VSAQIRLRVELDGRDAYIVGTRLVDHNMWDTTRAKHGWPKPDEAPFTWQGFLAWAASRRTGLIDPELTWERFLTECLGVESLDDDTGKVADPTPPGVGPG
jgi:hypothetical protein